LHIDFSVGFLISAESLPHSFLELLQAIEQVTGQMDSQCSPAPSRLM